MAEVVKSATFNLWLSKLRDRRAAIKVLARVDRLAAGNPGDVKSVGFGISEMRIDHGPGYRIYYTQKGSALVILLCGGDKSTQGKDILLAKEIAESWGD